MMTLGRTLILKASKRDRSKLYVPVALLLVLLTFAMYVRSIEWQPNISDSVGYLQASHQIARGESLAYRDIHNRLGHPYFTLFAFNVSRPGEADPYLSFPPGYPILLALFERLVGNTQAVFYVGPFCVAVTIAALNSLARRWFGGWAGFWAATSLAVSGVMLRFGTSIWSEAPSAMLLVLGLYLFVRATDPKIGARSSVCLSSLSGLVLGLTFFMRFANITVLPVMLFVGWRQIHQDAPRNRTTPSLVIQTLMLGALLIFNTIYYGGPTVTGYSPLHGWYTQPAFSFEYALQPSFVDGRSLIAMANTISVDYSWMLVFAALALLHLRDIRIQLPLILSGALLAPYTIYAFAPAGINARFVIPALPMLSLLVGAGVERLSLWLPWRAVRWAGALIMLTALVALCAPLLDEVQHRNAASRQAIERVLEISAVSAPDAVFMSYNFNDMIAYYAQRSVLNHRRIPPYDAETNAYLFDRFESLFVDTVDQLLRAGTPVYYIRDGDNPLYHADEILMQHFQLDTVVDVLPVFQVSLRSQAP